LGSNYSSSKIGVQSPNDLCFYGGEFIDFASLSSIYNTTSIVWVGSKYILANCYNYGQTQPPTLMRINRNNGSFNPVGTNIPSNINLLGCTDSMAFFIGNNSLFWLNFNQNSIANTSSNNFSNLTGNILSDPKTNMIYVEYSNGWYKYNYSNNSYVPLTLPSGTKTFIGADSLLIGSNLYNMTNSAIIANLNLSNYTESPVRIGKTLVYESSSNSGGFAKLRCHHLNTGLNEDLTNNYGYWVYMSSSFFVDPVQFSRNVIDRKILLEYNGNPFQRINNHVISTGSVTSVGIYSGSPYLASAKEIIQTDLSGRIGTFLYGSFSNYGYGISRHGDYTVVQLNEPFGCHDGLIKKTTGIIIYDAR
jgi:hypothetical protein